MDKPKVVCIVGPTASGKTALGILVAKYLNGEIISADSMQVYKGMPIASAVPDIKERQGVVHHLLEFLDPLDQLTVARYQELALEKISEILKRGKTPIIVGGTGLYVDSVVNNLTYQEEDFDENVRRRLEKEYDENGAEKFHAKLKEIDAAAAERISPNDKKRLVRALELYENCGVTVSEQYENSRKTESPYEFIKIGINFDDRQKLYERINKRVDIMLQNGLVDEAKSFFNKANSKTAGFAAIGHKEMFPYFKGEISLEEAVENLKQQTRRYAKRQLTWFNKSEDINWVFPDLSEDVFEDVKKILEGRNLP